MGQEYVSLYSQFIYIIKKKNKTKQDLQNLDKIASDIIGLINGINNKRIEDYLLAEKNKHLAHKQFWHCNYCGNYNYAFRLVCNRCKAKREII